MKKIIYGLMLLASMAGLSSCDDEEYTDSQVTNYVTFDLTGGSTYTIPVGTTYTDPGFTAMEGTEDVASKVTISGNVDGSKVGYYPESYSAVNKDGYAASVERNVFVYNPAITTDLSGSYTTQAGTNRVTPSSGAVVAFSGQSITLSQVAPGIFYVSDLMGGYYDQRAGYGASYAMRGYISLNADNTLTPLYGHVAGWGDSYDDGSFSGSYDPATGAINISFSYAGQLQFNIILNK